MANQENPKPYDLEERTFQFAKPSRAFVKLLPRTIANIEDVKQFIRASGSVGANESEFRIRVCFGFRNSTSEF